MDLMKWNVSLIMELLIRGKIMSPAAEVAWNLVACCALVSCLAEKYFHI